MTEENISFLSNDGFKLEGTLHKSQQTQYAVLFVHGITVDREEDGFYTEFSKKLDSINVTSFRFDLRAHGKSEGKFSEVTLIGVINDIDSAYRVLKKNISENIPIIIIAASFGAGLSANWVAKNSNYVKSLILLNPLLDYGKRMLFDKPQYWKNESLTAKAINELKENHFLPHGDFQIGRSLLNELFYIRPYQTMQKINIPVLTIHGDEDSMVPYDIAKHYALVNAESDFVTIPGADHGFVHPDDEDYTHPETISNREIVFNKVIEWIKKIK